MTKFIIRFIFLLIVSIVFSSISEKEISIDVLSTFYTVTGIMFSIGLGVIAGFDLRDIKNKEDLYNIRRNIKQTRNSFIALFILATFCFMFYQYLKVEYISLNLHYFTAQLKCGVFMLFVILFAILYFIVNFLQLQKLRDQIVDKILEES